ncbi:MAG: rhomboid family intramembrane serine protease [Candidatus Pacearchaeota archaeon]
MEYQISKRKKLFNFNASFLIILLNVICFFVFSVLIYFNPSFIDYIALMPSNIINNFYFWTFFTSMFMHSGFFHLFVNMFSLMFVGNFVERLLGKKRFVLIYLLCGLSAGIIFVLSSLIWVSDFNTYAVGASGALFGLIGVMMLLTPNLPVYIMFIPIPIKMKYAAPGMLILLWLISIAGNVPIGNTAHFGGFVLGLAYGFYLRKKYKNKTKYISKYFS